jgi:hypothetical protein
VVDGFGHVVAPLLQAFVRISARIGGEKAMKSAAWRRNHETLVASMRASPPWISRT